MFTLIFCISFSICALFVQNLRVKTSLPTQFHHETCYCITRLPKCFFTSTPQKKDSFSQSSTVLHLEMTTSDELKDVNDTHQGRKQEQNIFLKIKSKVMQIFNFLTLKDVNKIKDKIRQKEYNAKSLPKNAILKIKA